MGRATLFIVIFFATQNFVGAQSSSFDRQFTAIRQLLEDERFEVARVQARALAGLTADARLPQKTAEANFLIARSYLDIPQPDARTRVEGIKSLRLAGRAYAQVGDQDMLNIILEELGKLTGETNTIADLRNETGRSRRPRSRIRAADSLALESTLLQALVANQGEAIDSLNAEQMRNAIQLQQQRQLYDSLALHALEDSLLVVQQQMQLNGQAAQIESQRQARNFLYLLGAAILTILGVLYWRFLSSRRYQAQLETKNTLILAEQKRSEELLLNVLPASVATELKEKGKATARRHEKVTVLFADFKGFSVLANQLTASEVVDLLDQAFQRFDRIIRENGLEKIKTIGDAYMCAAGLPEPQEDHADRCVRAALSMQEYLADHPQFSARIGVHSGPVVAGVVGLDKFAYDIWGDTVNRAARLEISGEAGKVNVSSDTKQLLDPSQYQFTPRGHITIKNLGEVEMFYVDLVD